MERSVAERIARFEAIAAVGKIKKFFVARHCARRRQRIQQVVVGVSQRNLHGEIVEHLHAERTYGRGACKNRLRTGNCREQIGVRRAGLGVHGALQRKDEILRIHRFVEGLFIIFAQQRLVPGIQRPVCVLTQFECVYKPVVGNRIAFGDAVVNGAVGADGHKPFIAVGNHQPFGVGIRNLGVKAGRLIGYGHGKGLPRLGFSETAGEGHAQQYANE